MAIRCSLQGASYSKGRVENASRLTSDNKREKAGSLLATFRSVKGSTGNWPIAGGAARGARTCSQSPKAFSSFLSSLLLSLIAACSMTLTCILRVNLQRKFLYRVVQSANRKLTAQSHIEQVPSTRLDAGIASCRK
jgi:hypothetical protein